MEQKKQTPQDLKETAMQYLYKPDQHVTINASMMQIKHAYTWLHESAKKPAAGMLFDQFWHEGELCMLFGDTGVGKSILGVQIADSISKGEPVPGFKMESKKQPVLYVDMKLSEKQLEMRYSGEDRQHYTFDPGFIRAIDHHSFSYGKRKYEDVFISSLQQSIEISDTKVLVIDNMIHVSDGTTRSMKNLLTKLNELKVKYGVSVLVLAHCHGRTAGKHITRWNAEGRRGLISHCDSAFCIGESNTGESRVYLKQLKSNSAEIVYGAKQVCVMQRNKKSNFLQLEFLHYGREEHQIMNEAEQDKFALYQEILELKKQGKSNVEIAKSYGVTEGSVRLWLKRGEEKYYNLATNATSHTSPGGVTNPFGASVESPINAEGVFNPSGVDNATNATNHTSPGGVINPFGALAASPSNAEGASMESSTNAEGVLNPSGVVRTLEPDTAIEKRKRLPDIHKIVEERIQQLQAA